MVKVEFLRLGGGVEVLTIASHYLVSHNAMASNSALPLLPSMIFTLNSSLNPIDR